MSDQILPKHRDFLAAHGRGVLVTVRRNGRPQLSNVLYHYDPGTDVARVSVTDDRAKTRNARREPWVALQVSSDDFWGYAVAEGRAELTEVAGDPHDEVVEELVDYYRTIRGEHPDWEDYRAAQVAEGRLILRLHLERTYGAVIQ